MQSNLKKNSFKISFLFIFFVFNVYENTYAKIANTIVGKVEKEIITSVDLHNQIRLNLYSNGLIEDEVNYLSERVDNGLEKGKEIIKDNITYLERKEIDKYKIEIYSQEELNININSIAKKINVEDIKKDFNNRQLNYKFMKDGLILDLKWNTLIYSLYQNQININPTEIENRVDELLETEVVEDSFNLSEIILKDTEDYNKKFAEIRKLNNNNEFGKAVKLFSSSTSAYKNGNLGWFKKKDLNKQYINNIINLKIGEITKPFKVDGSFLILRLNEKKFKEKKVDRDKVREKVKGFMKNQKLTFYSRNHFNTVKSNILIKIK